MMRSGLACACLLLLATTLCAEMPSGARPADQVVARVGNQVITSHDLAVEIPDQYKAQYERVLSELASTRDEAVRDLLGRRQVAELARRRHVSEETMYRELAAREHASFAGPFEAKLHQLEASLYEADSITLEEIIDRRLLAEAKTRGLTVSADVKADDLDFLRAYEKARARTADSGAAAEKLMSDAAAEARDAVVNARLVAAARAVVPVERSLAPPRIDVATDGYPRIGSNSAPVQLVVFTDFECPYCAELEPVLREVERKYGNSVSIVTRDFPMPTHPSAVPAAMAARCAAAQRRYREMHDLLFANRTELTEENFQKWATQTGIDVVKFSACEAAPETRAVIEREIEEGKASGVEGTPTVFVNGRMMTGDRTVESISKLIDDELARKR